MALSKEVRLLKNKWDSGQGWPKRLEWVEIRGLRGWIGQRIDFRFPIVALVGENGVGKSTILQAAASVYKSASVDRFASDFFPDTVWESISGASIHFCYKEGNNSGSKVDNIRRPSNRWRGNPSRPERSVIYTDLARVQPIATRVGYARIAKTQCKELTSNQFDEKTLSRLSNILARRYDIARFATTDIDGTRPIPVLTKDLVSYSGFHQGTGETGTAELLRLPIPKNSMVLIDEIEASLHPRAQRRMIRDLAQIAKDHDLQFIITTHSPYILSELPPEARVYLMDGADGKQAITGVSPEFAMTKMDDESYPECDLYVEDPRAEALLKEILIRADRELVSRMRLIPFGAASVGRALGQMVVGKKFPRPSSVYLDGDQEPAPGCNILPGGDAPERVVFEGLYECNWGDLHSRVGRSPSEVIDVCSTAMTLNDHREWVKSAADKLVVGSDILWQALCATWVQNRLDQDTCKSIADDIKAKLDAMTTSSLSPNARPLPF